MVIAVDMTIVGTTSFTTASQIVTIRRFAVKFTNPETFTLMKLFNWTFFDYFEGKIFSVVSLNCFADS